MSMLVHFGPTILLHIFELLWLAKDLLITAGIRRSYLKVPRLMTRSMIVLCAPLVLRLSLQHKASSHITAPLGRSSMGYVQARGA